MFGYLVASSACLTEEEMNRYKAGYCGLCRSLKKRHGQLSRLTLNYDMTFLILVLESLYEPKEEQGSDICIAHPREKRTWWCSEISDYAADMNIALAYLNRMDDWQDDARLFALAEAAVLKKAYSTVCVKYPRQCQAMEQSISALRRIEKSNTDDPDAAAATFGHLMGNVFIYKEDRWQDTLFRMGDSLGRFIYLLDACMDLEQDTLRNRYNPFRKYYGLENEKRFRSILKIFLADTIHAYETLPLVEDTGVIKNILCIGLWTEFDKKFKKNKGEGDDTGSV